MSWKRRACHREGSRGLMFWMVVVLAVLSLVSLSAACSDDSQGADGGADGGADACTEAGTSSCAGPCKVALLAGTPGGRGAVDGVGTSARTGLVRDMVGDGKYIYFADSTNAAVRRLELATNKVTTIAGALGLPDPTPRDGDSKTATFHVLWAIALLGRTLYVSDIWPDWVTRLRKISLDTGQVKTVLDKSTGKPWQPAGSMKWVLALAVDGTKLYLAEPTAIWAHDPAQGTFQALAGSTSEGGVVDGTGTAVRFSQILSMDHDGKGALYAGDVCFIRRVDLATGVVKTVAGDKILCGQIDGKGSMARFLSLWGISADQKDLYAADYASTLVPENGTKPVYSPNFGVIRQVDTSTYSVTTLAGSLPNFSSIQGESDGAAAQARFIEPSSIWAGTGAVYLGTHASIRKVDKGQVSTIAGTLLKGAFLGPQSLALHGKHLYVYLQLRAELVRVDLATGSHDIMRTYDKKTFPVDSCSGMARLGNIVHCAAWDGGIIATDMAAAKDSYSLVYPNPSGPSFSPTDLTTDGKLLYLLASVGSGAARSKQVWSVDPAAPNTDYKVVLPAGKLKYASRIAFAAGMLYITSKHTLYSLDPMTSALKVVAGATGQSGCKDGVGTTARFRRLESVAADGPGKRLFLGDRGCHTLHQLDLVTGKVVTLAGDPGTPLFKAGMGAAAGINRPTRMAFDDTNKTLYVADDAENIIMKVTGP